MARGGGVGGGAAGKGGGRPLPTTLAAMMDLASTNPAEFGKVM